MLSLQTGCEFWNELLNFATNFRTSQRSFEYYGKKLAEIDCKPPGRGLLSLVYYTFRLLNMFVLGANIYSFYQHAHLILNNVIMTMHIMSTDEDPSLRIESFAATNLRGVSTNYILI